MILLTQPLVRAFLTCRIIYFGNNADAVCDFTALPCAPLIPPRPDGHIQTSSAQILMAGDTQLIRVQRSKSCCRCHARSPARRYTSSRQPSFVRNLPPQAQQRAASYHNRRTMPIIKAFVHDYRGALGRRSKQATGCPDSSTRVCSCVVNFQVAF